MRDLHYIKNFASVTQFGVTAPLTHCEVKILANAWLPEMRFHEKDLYHPIGLSQLCQQALVYADSRYDLWIKAEGPTFQVIDAKPPVVFLAHQAGPSGYPVQTSDAMDARDLSSGSYVTSLKDLNYERSKEIFGSVARENGYQVPRLPLSIIAEFRMLRDALKHNLLAHRDQAFPKDADGTLLDAIRGHLLWGSNDGEWDLLLQLIAASEQGDHELEKRLLDALQVGRISPVITREQWRVIRDFGFLEYYFVYAYNDTEYYPELSGLDSNEHEADIEGCCLAFRRDAIQEIRRFRDQSARNDFLTTTLTPHCMMTAAHAARNGLDGIRVFDRARSAADIRNRGDLVVWVALASHATYLDGTGDHNINAVTDELMDVLDENGLAAALCFLLPCECIAVALIAAAFDHWNDATDKTSNGGVYAGSPDPPGTPGEVSDAQRQAPVVETTPLSVERNIYIGSVLESGDAKHTLAQRSFPGKWGGHDCRVDDSPRFGNLTSRFCELLLRRGDG